MRRTERPILAERLALAAFLFISASLPPAAFGRNAPAGVRVTEADIALTAAEEVEILLSGLQEQFAAQRQELAAAPLVPLVAPPLAALRRRVDAEDLPADKKAALAGRLDKLVEIVERLKAAEGKTPGSVPPAALARLGEAARTTAPAGSLKPLEEFSKDVASGRQAPQAALAQLFENGRLAGSDIAAEPVLADAPSGGAQSLVNAAPAPVRIDGQVPDLPAALEPAPARAAASQGTSVWDRLSQTFGAAVTPFEKLTPQGRQEAFEKDRAALRKELQVLAGQALAEGGVDAAGFKDLDKADTRLNALRGETLRGLGFDKPAADAAEAKKQRDALTGKSPALSLYIAKRGLYQDYVNEALHQKALK
ncbi:MAG: hypothetical protein HYV15_02785, partial [Elusimicrobia bacterium]|nr:hypothetical protein [Elusimicrobiota bacterium]